MSERGSSNSWKFLAIFAGLFAFAAPFVVHGPLIHLGKIQIAPAKTAVAEFVATATPASSEPTPDCCRVGHDWIPTEYDIGHRTGGCEGNRPLARCKNCGLWRSEK